MESHPRNRDGGMDSRRKRDIPSGEDVCRVEWVWVLVPQPGERNPVSKLGLSFEFVSDRRAKSVRRMEDGKKVDLIENRLVWLR